MADRLARERDGLVIAPLGEARIAGDTVIDRQRRVAR
jgi:hypothetical protein